MEDRPTMLPTHVSRGQVVFILCLCVFATLAGWTAASLSRPAAVPPYSYSYNESAFPDPLRTAPREYDWTRLPTPLFPIPPYAEHLSGRTIVLDPGHIGQKERDGYKISPGGLREAVVNLAVARYLREFLEAAGATVILTRDRDAALGLSDADDLEDRASIANRARADLLLSIHHDAAANTAANYSRVFYHADPDHHPASLCAARHIVFGLADALHLPQQQPVPLASDMVRYEGSGYRVLRLCEVPAVLSEASFFSNPDEEQRLRDPLYNRREAYGLFVGLARWALSGLPAVEVLPPERNQPAGTLRLKLDDGLTSRGGFTGSSRKILARTISVEWAGRPLSYSFDSNRSEIRVELPDGRGRGEALFVDFANIFGQHVLHPRVDVP